MRAEEEWVPELRGSYERQWCEVGAEDLELGEALLDPTEGT